MDDMEIAHTQTIGNHEYEIVKSAGPLNISIKYYMHKDGEPHRGSFDTLEQAINALQEES